MTIREAAEACMVWRDPDIADIEEVIRAAIKEEREACAKIAELVRIKSHSLSVKNAADVIARDIRARSKAK